jgi:hypothetical protein
MRSSRGLFWLRSLLLVVNQVLLLFALRLSVQVFWDRAVIPETERFEVLQPRRYAISKAARPRRPLESFETVWRSLREIESPSSVTQIEASPPPIESPVKPRAIAVRLELELCGAGFASEAFGHNGGFFRVRGGATPVFVRVGELLPGTSWRLIELRERESKIEAELVRDDGGEKVLLRELSGAEGGR